MTKTKKTKTKKSKSSRTVAPGPSHAFDLDRFKNMVIIALIAVIVGVTSAFGWSFMELRRNSITAKQRTYLAVFDELAENFIRNQDISANGHTVAGMTGYGVSDEDGAFYISFQFTVVDDEGNLVDDLRNAKVYFWPDEERGGYSYAYSYD